MKTVEETLREWSTPLQEDLALLYLVGGSVRDRIIGWPVKDLCPLCSDAEALAKQLAGTGDPVVEPFEKKANEPCYRVVDRQNPKHFFDVLPMRGHTVLANLERRDFAVNWV